MSVKDLLPDNANVQIVCGLADLRELFMTWQDEREAQQQPQVEDTNLTVEETAKKLGVTKTTLWRWQKIDYLKPVKVGRKSFYRSSEVNNLLRKEA